MEQHIIERVMSSLNDNNTIIELLSEQVISYVCGFNNIQIIQITINNDVVITDKCFIRACRAGNYQIVKLLIENGANVNYNDDKALYECCFEGHYELCELLLDHGANIKSGKCLVIACQVADIKIVRLLLRYGFDPCYNNGEAFKTCLKGYGFYGEFKFYKSISRKYKSII
uniref:Ankyrin repeat-containing protein n=1 Tax=Borely moumouvirus TaxID=2712067 RepID=A0A6G6ABT9_9VIRU